MRNLYLHIGCQKTGSSALQVWFSQIAEVLKTKGVFYPQKDVTTNPYQITSGNAEDAFCEIKAGRGRDYFRNVFDEHPDTNILLSSEIFCELSLDDCAELNEFFTEENINVVIIAYVRNLYDFVFSLHSQVVKRHGCSLSFREFVFDPENQDLLIRNLNDVERFASHFGNIHVIHYDEVKSSLDLAFLDAIGVDPKGIPRMSKKKVNRSLSIFELELLRRSNDLYSRTFRRDASEFSKEISDALIYADPESETEFYYDEEVGAYLEEKYGARLTKFNQRFFSQGRGLRIIDEQIKLCIAPDNKINKAYFIVLEKLFDLWGASGQLIAQVFVSGYVEYSESASTRQSFAADGVRKTLAFSLPPSRAPLRGVRFDPANQPAAITLHMLALEAADGTVLWRWDGQPGSLRNVLGLALRPGADGLLLVCWNDDPQFEIAIPEEVLAGVGPGAQLVVEMTPRPLLEVLPELLAERPVLPATSPVYETQFCKPELSKSLEQIVVLLQSSLGRRDQVIAEQSMKLRAMRDELLRAEAQLDLLKDLVR